MKEQNLGCAVELYNMFGEGGFWLFFEDKKTAQKTICNEQFFDDYEYPSKAIFCNLIKNDDDILITCNDFESSEVYTFNFA